MIALEVPGVEMGMISKRSKTLAQAYLWVISLQRLGRCISLASLHKGSMHE